MNMIKKLGYLCFCAALAAGITSCNGGNKNDEGQASVKQVVMEDKAEHPAQAKVSDKPLDHPAH